MRACKSFIVRHWGRVRSKPSTVNFGSLRVPQCTSRGAAYTHPGRYNPLKMTCRMRSVHYRPQNVPAFPKPWWSMQFGEHRAKKQGHTNAICFRSGCDPQTHWDDTTHSRCRAIHMRSSSKTPGRTSPPRSFGGTCHLEKAELKNKVTQTPSALDTGVTHRHTGTIQLTQGDVPCM